MKGASRAQRLFSCLRRARIRFFTGSRERPPPGRPASDEQATSYHMGHCAAKKSGQRARPPAAQPRTNRQVAARALRNYREARLPER
eukprot:8225006-Pyramimonas_sp.AAC.1